jgi:ribA/ribD-fused uncharacterized protein
MAVTTRGRTAAAAAAAAATAARAPTSDQATFMASSKAPSQSRYHPFLSGVLSNWSPTPFTDDDGVAFRSAEQYMMYHKALLFHDHVTADRILQSTTPREQKALGRTVANFDEATWGEHRCRIVKRALVLKFEQNRSARDQLLAFGDVTFVEGNAKDRTWGVGLAHTDRRCHDPAEWRGLNLLGKLLSEVRDEILAAAQPPPSKQATESNLR